MARNFNKRTIKQINQALSNFGDTVVKESLQELKRLDKNVTNRLSNSLDYKVNVKNNKANIKFEYDEYLMYVDLGVNGKEVPVGSPFSFREKMPPADDLAKWAKDRSLGFKDENGKRMTYKQMGFVLSRSIFKKGIRPSLFFTDSFENAFDGFPDRFSTLIADSVNDFVSEQFKLK